MQIEEIVKKKIIHTMCEAEEIETDILFSEIVQQNLHLLFMIALFQYAQKITCKEINLYYFGITSKEGLSSNAENIGKLLNRKNIYFIPFLQDNPITKPTSLSFSPKYIIKSKEYSLECEQIQPLLL